MFALLLVMPPSPGELILTHDHADFDAFASQVGASLVHQGASILRGTTADPAVRDFMVLHERRFPLVDLREISLDRITRLIIVDVRRADRMAHAASLLARPGVARIVYDHHAPSAGDLAADEVHVEAVGATTTLLVERLEALGRAVDPIEATALALGVYADTGRFAYAGTTPRDLEAAAWLLRQGARLPVVNRFLDAPYDREQREALLRLLGRAEVRSLSGFQVALLAERLPAHVEGLADVVGRLAEIEGHDAVIAAFAFGERRGRVQVIARSRAAALDVAAALRALGGGGHEAAAAAGVEDGGPREVCERAFRALAATPPPVRRVADAMTAPVFALAPETPIAEAERLLDERRVSGAPVVRDGAVVGVVSRRDLAKGRPERRLATPISSCMSRAVATIGPEAPLEAALALMVERGIGRLPVLAGGRLVGIITRTDALAYLYGARAPAGRGIYRPG